MKRRSCRKETGRETEQPKAAETIKKNITVCTEMITISIPDRLKNVTVSVMFAI